MIPAIVIPEVLAEALLFFRRALTVYRVTNAATSIAGTVDSLLHNELRNHRDIEGEDAFFYILGSQFLSRPEFNKENKITDRQKHKIILDTLINPVFTSASVDVKSKTVNFLYSLGMEWANVDQAASEIMSKSLASIGSRFTYSDPMQDYFSTFSKLSSQTVLILENLGIKSKELTAVVENYKDKKFTAGWDNLILKLSNSKTPIYKLHTAVGTMLTGAQAVEVKGLIDIPVTGRPASMFSLSITSAYMQKGGYKESGRSQLPEFRSITKEMVDQASANIMEQRGFVKVDNKWQPLAESVVAPVDKDGNQEFINNSQLTVLANVASTLENKTRALSRLNRIRDLRKLIAK